MSIMDGVGALSALVVAAKSAVSGSGSGSSGSGVPRGSRASSRSRALLSAPGGSGEIGRLAFVELPTQEMADPPTTECYTRTLPSLTEDISASTVKSGSKKKRTSETDDVSGQKHNNLTLSQKMEIILGAARGKKQKELGKEFGISQPAVAAILHKKEELLKRMANGEASYRKRSRYSNSQDPKFILDRRLLEFINMHEAENINSQHCGLAREEIFVKAAEIGLELDIERNPGEPWTPSTGWFARFRSTYNLSKSTNYIIPTSVVDVDEVPETVPVEDPESEPVSEPELEPVTVADIAKMTRYFVAKGMVRSCNTAKKLEKAFEQDMKDLDAKKADAYDSPV
jgi:hypothetical protein